MENSFCSKRSSTYARRRAPGTTAEIMNTPSKAKRTRPVRAPVFAFPSRIIVAPQTIRSTGQNLKSMFQTDQGNTPVVFSRRITPTAISQRGPASLTNPLLLTAPSSSLLDFSGSRSFTSHAVQISHVRHRLSVTWLLGESHHDQQSPDEAHVCRKQHIRRF